MVTGQYTELVEAYNKVRDLIYIDSLEAIIEGFIITTFVFKLVQILRESNADGKGINARQFFEMGREYIYCIAIVALFPVILNALEQMLAYGADKIVEQLPNNGEIDDTLTFESVKKAALDEYTREGILGWVEKEVWGGLGSIATQIASWLLPIYDYITIVFLAGRYIFLLLLEVISPFAIAMFYNEDTRQSSYTWLKSLIGCYMLYPALVIASLFADKIVEAYIIHTAWPAWILIVFALTLKINLLNVVKASINKLF